jgi:hypothetical protein
MPKLNNYPWGKLVIESTIVLPFLAARPKICGYFSNIYPICSSSISNMESNFKKKVMIHMKFDLSRGEEDFDISCCWIFFT